MKSFVKIVSILSVFCASLNGCGVDEITPPESDATAPAVITTELDGARAASQVMQTAELVFNTSSLMKALGSHARSVIQNDPTVTLTSPVLCDDYGTFTYTGSVDGMGQYDLSLTYELCRQDGMQFDGLVTVTGTLNSLQVTVGGQTSGFRIIDFNNNYSAISGIISVSAFSYSMTDNGSSPGLESYFMQLAGSLTAFDYIMLGQLTTSFSGVQVQYDEATAGGGVSIAATGKIRQFSSSSAMSIELTNFLTTRTPDAGGTGKYATVSGIAAYTALSAGGLDGIITVSTTAPIFRLDATTATTAGSVTLSGTGTATAQYGVDESVTLSVTGGTPMVFVNEYLLFKVVNIYGFEQAQPEFLGNAGTVASPGAVVAQGSIWPATMTITALSSGPDLECFTDVHVLYFSPADIPTKTITWYVDWNINLVNECAPPPGIPFEEARDVSGDSTCDAGLDINGADQDITSGGVEHFTATVLPEGYYVLSINNYSCPTSVSNVASLVVGDYMFGTYNCTYTTSDGDGSSPGAWCRLADLQVNADGSFEVKTPDAAFNPWHN